MTRTPPQSTQIFPSGIDALLCDGGRLAMLRRRRIALLTNAACRTATGTPSAEALSAALGHNPDRGLVRLFSPEHGPSADQAAGVAVADRRSAPGAPETVSLYGERRAPAPEHFEAIDSLIIDLRDVGVRCYTYATTAAIAAAAALDSGLDVIICNRLNPLGTVTFGPALDSKFRSFLAYFNTPFGHGKTIGELVAGTLGDHTCADNLTVISPPTGATSSTGPWIAPSPSLQTPESVQFYAGLVLFEATNLSEGRGTPLPFCCIGAPWLDAAAAADAANNWPTGITAAPCEIQPDGGDYTGYTLPALRFEPSAAICDGFGLGVRLLDWISTRHNEFAWRSAPVMSLEAGSGDAAPERYVIDTLLGSDSLRKSLARGVSAEDILAGWRG